jgi:hypothetical protein
MTMGEVWCYRVVWGGEPDLDHAEMRDAELEMPERAFASKAGAMAAAEAELLEAAREYLLGKLDREPPGLAWDDEGRFCRVAGTEEDGWPPAAVVGRMAVED